MFSKKPITASMLARRAYCVEARRLEMGGAISANQRQMDRGTKAHDAWRDHDVTTAGSLITVNRGMVFAFGLLIVALLWLFLSVQ